MYLLRDYPEGIERFLCSNSRKAFILSWVVLAAALAGVGAVFLWMGAPPIDGYPVDPPLFLDVAWRIFNGQTPHQDFYLLFGDLPFYVTWLGMKLGHSGVGAITCGNNFMMVAAGLAAMTILRRRTSAFYACLFSLFIALLVVTPRPLSFPHEFACYSMICNRYGEAFLALLGAVLFLTPQPALKEGWADWAEVAFAGCCLIVLFFCKLNYFAVGAGFFALACLRGRFTVQQTLLSLLSAAAFLSVALLLTKIPLPAIYGDYRMMVGAQDPGSRLDHLAMEAVKGALFYPVFLLMVWEISRKQTGRWQAWPHLLLITVIFGSELLLVASNTQRGELPLLALAALYGAETIRRQTRSAAEDGFFIAVRNSGAALLVLFFLLPTVTKDLETIRFCVRVNAQGEYATSDTLRSTRLSDFRICDPGYLHTDLLMQWMDKTDEGIQLLRRHADPSMRLAVFAYSDPYHVALGLPPAIGSVLAWGSASLSRHAHPTMQKMVGNATHILVDREVVIADIYGGEWDALHWQIVEQTKHFTLFKAPNS